MIQELIYTSAPKGLKPGSRGFCTVAATKGLSKSIADRLESLSGYRHLFASGSSDASLNPVNYAHYRFEVHGHHYHSLTRIADAGLDYSQRTNKIVHHLVFDQIPQTPSPAWWLNQPNEFRIAWTEPPQELDARPSFPTGTTTPNRCQYWESITGDAGWAGRLLETAMQGDSHLYVQYELGTDVLRLISEAMALMPHATRWQTTFSSFYAKLPPGVACQWRFVPNHPDIDLLKSVSPASILDLTRLRGQVAASIYAAAAREGTAIEVSSNFARPTATRLTDQMRLNADQNDVEYDEDDAFELEAALPPSHANRSLPPSAPTRPRSRSDDINEPQYRRPLWQPLAIAAAVILITAMLVMAGTLGFRSFAKRVPEHDSQALPNDTKDQNEPNVLDSGSLPDAIESDEPEDLGNVDESSLDDPSTKESDSISAPDTPQQDVVPADDNEMSEAASPNSSVTHEATPNSDSELPVKLKLMDGETPITLAELPSPLSQSKLRIIDYQVEEDIIKGSFLLDEKMQTIEFRYADSSGGLPETLQIAEIDRSSSTVTLLPRAKQTPTHAAIYEKFYQLVFVIGTPPDEKLVPLRAIYEDTPQNMIPGRWTIPIVDLLSGNQSKRECTSLSVKIGSEVIFSLPNAVQETLFQTPLKSSSEAPYQVKLGINREHLTIDLFVIGKDQKAEPIVEDDKLNKRIANWKTSRPKRQKAIDQYLKPILEKKNDWPDLLDRLNGPMGNGIRGEPEFADIDIEPMLSDKDAELTKLVENCIDQQLKNIDYFPESLIAVLESKMRPQLSLTIVRKITTPDGDVFEVPYLQIGSAE